MNNFGRNYPVLSGIRRADERERLFFFAAAGLAAFLFFTVIFVLNMKEPAVAKEQLASAEQDAAPAALGTVTLLAPERSVRAGTKLSEIRLKEVYWPRNQVPQEAVRDMAEIRDQFAAADIPEGMPLQRHHLTHEAINATLPLTPGNRAVAIEVDATAGIEGWALPGSRVDVVLTSVVDGNLKSQILVQNARVLSYGGNNESAESPTRLRNVAREVKKTITMDVSTEDALKIATARELGRLSLLMRTPDDQKAAAVIEMDKNKINPQDKNSAKRSNCTRGSMKMDGKEFMIGCDGSVNMLDEFEP
ncbi:MAG: Flp pilus assembly protein CpaB [Oligoflexia bacterium]|nr:Flp pilus assembly protein CpaB [Oligoflexia bacterium]